MGNVWQPKLWKLSPAVVKRKPIKFAEFLLKKKKTDNFYEKHFVIMRSGSCKLWENPFRKHPVQNHSKFTYKTHLKTTELSKVLYVKR